MTDTLRTPLYDLHVELGAKIVPFAGYDMPLQYEGIMAEHNHTRDAAGLFDVSHMGQAHYTGDEAALEKLITADLSALAPGEQRYTLLLNDQGGIMDDLMVSRPFGDDGLFLVVNAAMKANDFAHIEAKTGGPLNVIEDRALVALQGPQAADVFSAMVPGAGDLVFMQCGVFELDGVEIYVSRSGYTGEDGYEISIPAGQAEAIVRKLLSDGRVKPIGLGARDSLRLEAGLCLYGHDMDETKTPAEATLMWAVAKPRRERMDFPGAARVMQMFADKPARKRVGFVMDGAPAREGAEIIKDGKTVGVVTSGGFGPTVGGPVGMAYVDTGLAVPDTEIEILLRGKARPARIAKMPFVEQRYYRGN
ncbi:glycine cleavage system aminomethyltransferase GcvT [Hyphobacterium sp. HN65]|uniref:aminomethyltransferase n=1 Tax=Hyphobacterium lacteum TaxID=3116575 RepID=A0ABU7LN12_9PROT|nr:glycine cleavage system aminomethyltransferase GcvT [Hyphobacterium sp. HN65]MEE2525292.1 glycine cleavage system aminomethyltransferase GcvT [Hyphobacterium sp. HN65]